MKGRFFKLFANCIPVRGARRSTLCDLQRNTYHFIPNGLFDILTQYRDRPLEEIKDAFPADDGDTIDEYFQFLERNELGFWCDDPESFPELDLSWETPEEITNAIVDLDEDSRHDFGRIVEQLDTLRCRALQVRSFAAIEPRQVEALLASARGSRLRSIELILKHSPAWTDETLEALCRRHARITQIWIHSAPKTRSLHLRSGSVQVAHVPQEVGSERDCGEVHPAYFAPTLDAFLEAQKCNSCLNRKISVDRRGEIRNCPAMERSFGNLRTTSLPEVAARPEFRSVWSVSKDEIEICRDCEFRYICTDCRVHVEDPSKPNSKPSKCSYDPYTASWG